MGDTVSVGADFGTVRVLRAYEGFEDVYQGKTIDHPIYLSDTSETPTGRDPQAEKAFGMLASEARSGGSAPFLNNNTGIEPNLVAGVPVPLGARCILYLPFTSTSYPSAGPPFEFHLIWRLRSPRVFRENGRPYHKTTDGDGVPASEAGGLYDGPARQRLLIVAARETITFQQPEPTFNDTNTFFGEAQQNVWPVKIVTHYEGRDLHGPWMPSFQGGAAVEGYVEQGVEYGTYPQAPSPKFVAIERRALGDELVIAVTRPPADPENPRTAEPYDFNTTDFFASCLFGRCGYSSSPQPTVIPFGTPIPQLGVLLVTGTAP